MKKLIVISSLVWMFCLVACDPGGTVVYAVGDRGPAGGWIFYVDELDEHPWTYLEAAADDYMAGSGFAWSNITGTAVGVEAQGIAIGTGASNTTAIIGQDGHTGSAAAICDAFVSGGHGDWFLPSRDELNLMFEYLHEEGIGNFSSSKNYWTSTEVNASQSSVQYFGDGGFLSANKSQSETIRPIRAF